MAGLGEKQVCSECASAQTQWLRLSLLSGARGAAQAQRPPRQKSERGRRQLHLRLYLDSMKSSPLIHLGTWPLEGDEVGRRVRRKLQARRQLQFPPVPTRPLPFPVAPQPQSRSHKPRGHLQPPCSSPAGLQQPPAAGHQEAVGIPLHPGANVFLVGFDSTFIIESLDMYEEIKTIQKSLGWNVDTFYAPTLVSPLSFRPQARQDWGPAPGCGRGVLSRGSGVPREDNFALPTRRVVAFVGWWLQWPV